MPPSQRRNLRREPPLPELVDPVSATLPGAAAATEAAEAAGAAEAPGASRGGRTGAAGAASTGEATCGAPPFSASAPASGPTLGSSSIRASRPSGTSSKPTDPDRSIVRDHNLRTTHGSIQKGHISPGPMARPGGSCRPAVAVWMDCARRPAARGRGFSLAGAASGLAGAMSASRARLQARVPGFGARARAQPRAPVCGLGIESGQETPCAAVDGRIRVPWRNGVVTGSTGSAWQRAQ